MTLKDPSCIAMLTLVLLILALVIAGHRVLCSLLEKLARYLGRRKNDLSRK